LTNDETLISQALPSDGGLVVYTGMNSNGEFFIGRKKYDATTGEEILVSDGLSIGTSPSTVSSLDDLTVNTLKVNISIDATTASVGINSLTVSNISSNGNTINLNKNTQVNGDLTVTGIATATTFAGNGITPIGGIIMWSGTIVNIPTGWALCDGTNGTPNLQDRFVVGAGSGYAVGATGGSADATLVSHSHDAISTATDSGHTHSYTESNANNRNITGTAPSCNTGVFSSTTGTGFANITVATSISTEGASATNANLPPFYALAFIMRVS
jgi:microcystin-dependent protein